MKNFASLLGLAILASFTLKAQTALPVLNAESGNRNLETANCWAFGSVSYSNLEFRIAGNWSCRTNQLTSQSTGACWIKTPWILPGSGNITLKTRLENSSGTSRGILVQYAPYNANSSNSTKEGTYTSFYTYAFPTPLNINIQTLSIPIPQAIANATTPYKILISFIGSGGNSRAYADDIAIPATYYANPANNCLPAIQINDKDADGVADADDQFPEDAERAYVQYARGANPSTLMFEDLWPAKGDYDFNDLVATYSARVITNASNKVVEVIINTKLRAIGASFNNGFAVQFDNLDTKAILNVKGNSVGNTKWYVEYENGTESDQYFANVVIFEEAYKILPSPGGSGVNVNPNGPFAAPVDLEVVVSFDVEQGIKVDDFYLNPYLIVNQERGREVHLADHVPSSLANEKLFSTEADATSHEKETYYRSKDNLPFALKVDAIIPHTTEKTDILTAYYKLADWAKTGGKEFAGWYVEDKENRNDKSLIYLDGIK